MMYYDIHTHRPIRHDSHLTAIYNFNSGDCISCCGLDLQRMYYSLGIHPWKISQAQLPKDLDFIEKTAIFECVKMIGECGLDKMCETPWDLQLRAFIAQAGISEWVGKPLIIHCVKAVDEIIALKNQIKPKQAWIIHGFRGKPQQMLQLIRHDFYLSFGKYFNEESIRQIPIDRMFLETDDSDDSIESLFQQVAGLLNLSENELSQQIEINFKRLFG